MLVSKANSLFINTTEEQYQMPGHLFCMYKIIGSQLSLRILSFLLLKSVYEQQSVVTMPDMLHVVACWYMSACGLAPVWSRRGCTRLTLTLSSHSFSCTAQDFINFTYFVTIGKTKREKMSFSSEENKLTSTSYHNESSVLYVPPF